MSPRTARSHAVRVCVEATGKRAFASAVDWPGWSRVGKNEEAALGALAEHAQRYAVVAAEAGVAFTPGEYVVIERFPGSPTTDFGVPDRPASAERERLTSAEARRMVSLVTAAWTVFDRVTAGAPSSLRKGPRGGGRDRDAIVEHVLAADNVYARKLGIRVPSPHRSEKKAIAVMRDAIVDTLSSARAAEPLVERGWLPRYGARRIAWHALDHAWEIENRSES
jgi:hypothetical protein